jgi:diguanylate cyclase (GGDEF)-like protein
MSHYLDIAERILRSLSELIGKPLRIAGDQTGEETAIRLGSHSVVESDGPLTFVERRSIREILDAAREAGGQETQIRELELRVSELAKQNLELTVKNSMLTESSSRDPLTGLYNRWHVMEKMESEINRSLRHGSPMALMMMDIDHFKSVNDTYGHTTGDHVLQVVARLLKESCRVYDVPGRFGGEEFCLLLPEIEMESTPSVAERIRHRLETTEMEVGGASLVVTASIGIAGLGAGSEDTVLSPAGLIDRADRALYAAKNDGRNRVAMWHAGIRSTRAVETDH